jgi:hypothetical protein
MFGSSLNWLDWTATGCLLLLAAFKAWLLYRMFDNDKRK